MRQRIATAAAALAALAIAAAPVAAQRVCQRTMGPYVSQQAAWSAAQQARARGYETSGVWGQGGIVREHSWSERRWFFNLFHPC